MAGDGSGMRVDLSAMDEVIRKLWGLLDEMDTAGTTAKYNTEIPATALGHESFKEAAKLHAAHGEMKTSIEAMIKKLHGLIDEFGTSTSKVRDKYSEQENANKTQMGGNSGGPKTKPGLE
ncbi:hypothetical protein [Streptomyces sp. NBC_01465]|uniref:hypothetical protein n=1 Tax=Streptomyces sp. NBC_01465 TaxID=2903878 RepID=UPI002E3083D4|nr:hypothetical protein [Streptomyces sp. NBC_01465]